MIIMLVPDKALLRDPADLFFGPRWYLQRHIPLWFFARAHFLVHMYTSQYLLRLRAQGSAGPKQIGQPQPDACSGATALVASLSPLLRLETRPAACIDSSRRALPGAAWWRPVGGRARIMITLCSANLPLTCPSPPANQWYLISNTQYVVSLEKSGKDSYDSKWTFQSVSSTGNHRRPVNPKQPKETQATRQAVNPE